MMEHREKNDIRIWELDFFRGIALILMIYFHIIFDLREFYNYPVSYLSGVNFYIGKMSVILFILISGISSSLSKSNIKRGLKVLGIALVITIITHLIDPAYGVKFGILHFLGISMLLYPIFSKLNKYLLIVLGTIIILLGYFVSSLNTSANYLFPLGITNVFFVSSDYYPLLPWFGVFLYGISLGKLFYSKRRSIFTFNIKDNLINIIGKKTLLVYVLHQPIIIVTFTLLKYSYYCLLKIFFI